MKRSVLVLIQGYHSPQSLQVDQSVASQLKLDPFQFVSLLMTIIVVSDEPRCL